MKSFMKELILVKSCVAPPSIDINLKNQFIGFFPFKTNKFTCLVPLLRIPAHRGHAIRHRVDMKLLGISFV